MIRGIVTSVVEGVIKRFTASGRADETISNREYLQHYGYTSRPLPGAELIILREGNNIIAVASDDRRYRISLENGEVALYTDEGDKIHLKRGRIIEITGGEKVVVSTKVAEINASVSATITSPEVTVVASTKVILDTPMTEITGELAVTGAATFAATLVASGALSSAVSISDPTGSMGTMREIYNNHTHPENGGGTTSATTQGM